MDPVAPHHEPQRLDDDIALGLVVEFPREGPAQAFAELDAIWKQRARHIAGGDDDERACVGNRDWLGSDLGLFWRVR